MRVNPLAQEFQKSLKGAVEGPGKSSSGSFMNELQSKIQEVNQLQNQADATMAKEASGGASNIHDTMIQIEEADISLRLLTKVRNKALDAYHEIMRMQF